MTVPAGPTGTVVLARARWPEPGDGDPPPLPGFVLSTFNPLVAAVADRCLTRRYGNRPAPDGPGRATAVVLVSASGDRTSAEHVRRTVADGGRPGPLLFFQSVPNSVVGLVAARWGLGGPVVCLCPTGAAADAVARDEAGLLLRGGEADEVLLILIEQPAGGGPDSAAALLIGRGGLPG
jgi:hypothetical protein